jgi:hypothetical protein
MKKIALGWSIVAIGVLLVFTFGVYFKIDFFISFEKIGLIIIVLFIILMPLKSIIFSKDNK